MTALEKIKITIKGYKTFSKLTPRYLTSMAVQGVASAFLPFINIYMSARIINTLANGEGLQMALVYVAATVLLNLLTRVVQNAMTRLNNYYLRKFLIMRDEPLNEKIREMDYERIEDVNVHQAKEKINMMQQTNGLGLNALRWNFISLIRGFFQIVFSVSLTVSAFASKGTAQAGWGFVFSQWFSVIVVVVIVANVVLGIYFTAVSTQKQSAVFQGFEQINRVGNYYYEHFLNYRIGKDMHLYDMGDSLMGEFEGFLSELNVQMNKYRIITTKYESLNMIVSRIVNAVIYVYVALKALFGGFSAGGIFQYAGALSQLSGGVTSFMTSAAMLMVNADALKLYYEFIEMPDVKYHGTLTTEKRADNDYAVEFHNVSFKYPGSEVYALRNLNLKVNVGQRMAVVGMNGSGKTTMIKLLCRLYDPTEGVITLNGVDIKKYNYKEYMDIFSVVFQDFKLFSFPLGQNVAANIRYDLRKAIDSLSKAGFGERMSAMPKGLDTPVYKDFEEDGVEISGGEAQKIALARALYKDAPFIVLDEPTAALDPISEYEIYSKFNEIVGEKTAIYISHRLSSCRFCDDIAVFHEGALIQRGSHETLLADDKGKYYELWYAQAQYYNERAVC